jgi:hypothetical protein
MKRKTLAVGLLFALFVLLSANFSLFWMRGGFYFYEYNKTILTLETVMTIGIGLFAIERFINLVLPKRNPREPISCVYFVWNGYPYTKGEL